MCLQGPLTIELLPALELRFWNLVFESADFASAWTALLVLLSLKLFPKYELADGTKLYLYQSRKLLVEEIPFELEEPPPLPLSLALVDLVELPDTSYAMDSLLSIYNLAQLPPPLKPRPAVLPKTPTGFISYDSGIPDFLVAGLEEEGGLVSAIVMQGMQGMKKRKKPCKPHVYRAID